MFIKDITGLRGKSAIPVDTERVQLAYLIRAKRHIIEQTKHAKHTISPVRAPLRVAQVVCKCLQGISIELVVISQHVVMRRTACSLRSTRSPFVKIIQIPSRRNYYM